MVICHQKEGDPMPAETAVLSGRLSDWLRMVLEMSCDEFTEWLFGDGVEFGSVEFCELVEAKVDEDWTLRRVSLHAGSFAPSGSLIVADLDY
jgi:hypothetical protein